MLILLLQESHLEKHCLTKGKLLESRAIFSFFWSELQKRIIFCLTHKLYIAY